MDGKKHRIAVISDTHGLLRPEIVEVLKTCEVILHGGDINRQKILDELGQIAETYVVRGNNDKEWAEFIPAELEVELFGLRFYMIHNRKQMRKELGETDIIIYGHSHKYEEKRENGRFYLNPGSCGPRRFRQPVTMAVIEVWPREHRWEVEKIDLSPQEMAGTTAAMSERDLSRLIRSVLREMNAGRTVDVIAAKCGADRELVEQICRIYVTHPGVDAEGILNKMEVSRLFEKNN